MNWNKLLVIFQDNFPPLTKGDKLDLRYTTWVFFLRIRQVIITLLVIIVMFLLFELGYRVVQWMS